MLDNKKTAKQCNAVQTEEATFCFDSIVWVETSVLVHHQSEAYHLCTASAITVVPASPRTPTRYLSVALPVSTASVRQPRKVGHLGQQCGVAWKRA